ncbi:MAG: hypothetical protein JXB03_00225 [Spirochaetales bacterium]|nr:hypothetical protein [Spirochaetales bacterium]
MKNRIMYGMIMTILIITLSCTGTTPPKSAKGAGGTIEIHISRSTSRDISQEDTEIGASVSNIYEICVYNNTSFISATAAPSQTMVTLPVPEGTYSVLALAGYGAQSRCVLLGSGILKPVTVRADEITTVIITLVPVTHQFSVPESISCMETYEVAVSGNTNNSVLLLETGGTTMDYRPYIELGSDGTNHYLTCTGDGSSWNGSIQCTAPAVPEETEIRFYGSLIGLCDIEYSLEAPLDALCQNTWSWLTSSVSQEVLDGETRKYTVFIPTATGLEVTVGW